MPNNPPPIERWLNEHGDALFQYAMLKTNDADVAADLVQDTFEAVIRNTRPFEAQSQVRTWLIGILRHKITDFYRQKYRQQPLQQGDDAYFEDHVFTPTGQWTAESIPAPTHDEEPHLLDNPAFLKALALCLDKLPALWRAVLEGKYLGEKESKQLCQELQISPTNFWQINHRAKLSMQQCLQKAWFKNEGDGN